MVLFEFDSQALPAESRCTPEDKVPLLRQYPDWRLLLTGHADERCSTEYHLVLGMQRALAAQEYLGRFGIDLSPRGDDDGRGAVAG
jgi:peptidoglycan-associated lipoprotein